MIWECNIFGYCFGAIPSGSQGLLWALCLGISSIRALDHCVGAGDQIQVEYVQDKCPTQSVISPTWNL